jgi:glutamyl/glutaminyl-tRNA synthetase
VNFLLAQKHGAAMVLRIEDTDMERSTRNRRSPSWPT